MKKILALAGVGALLLSGCSSADSPEPATPEVSTTPEVAEEPTPGETFLIEDFVVEEKDFLEALRKPDYDLDFMNDEELIELGGNVCAKLDAGAEIEPLMDWVTFSLSPTEEQAADGALTESERGDEVRRIIGTSISTFCPSYRDKHMEYQEEGMMEELMEDMKAEME